MANRFQRNQHALAWDFISERDGQHCIVPDCHGKKLQIDHADNDPANWKPDNLHFLCQTHNLKFRKLTTADKVKLIRDYSAKNVYVCVKFKGNPGTSILKQRVDYSQGSPEMQVNALAEISWREWVLTEIRETGFITKAVAIETGAEMFGCSTATLERYLKKLTNPRSEITVSKDELGVKVVRFK